MMTTFITMGQVEAQAADNDNSWHNYYYVNNKGEYVSNRYRYPKEAKQFNIPEYCFQNPGTYHFKGYEGCYSYTVITVKDTSYEATKSPRLSYLDSGFVVYTNTFSMPAINKAGQKADGYIKTIVKYCSPEMMLMSQNVE